MLPTSWLGEKLGEAAVQLVARKQINPYGYVPTFGVCILFIVVFALSGVVHMGQGIHSRNLFMIWTTVAGCILECLGWSCRLWSNKNLYDRTPFIIQIISTFIAPTFIAAANFIILGHIIKRLGPGYSRLAPRSYARIFVSVDIFALLVQTIGGAIASNAVLKSKDTSKGSHIMLFGIILSLVEIAVYVSLASGFFYNYSRGKIVRKNALPPDGVLMAERGQGNGARNGSEVASQERGTMTRGIKLVTFGLGFSTLALLARTVYRTVSLGAGFTSHINHSQVLFDVLDGLMIVIASVSLNLFHHGYLL